MIDPLAFYRSKIYSISDAAVLEITGRAGTSGVIEAMVVDALRMVPNTAYTAFRRLIDAGLVHPATRDTSAGRPNRYVITPEGLALLQRVEPLTLPAQQIQLAIP